MLNNSNTKELMSLKRKSDRIQKTIEKNKKEISILEHNNKLLQLKIILLETREAVASC